MKPIKRWVKRLSKRFHYTIKLKRTRRRAIYFASVFLICSLGIGWRINHVRAEHQKQELRTSLTRLTAKLQDSQKATTSTKQQLDDKKAAETRYKAQIDELNKQLQAKAEQKSLLDQVAQVVTPKVSAQSDDYYVNWIIQHESGGDPWAVNPQSGACGLFQRLPCNVPLGNVAVQMADGIAYINSRYGSAYQAYLYWQAHGNY